MAGPFDTIYNPFAPTGANKVPAGSTSATPNTPASGNTIEQLLAQLSKNQQPNPMADLGSVLGSFSSGQKANRIVEGNFQSDFDKMMLDRERNMNTLGLQAQADRNVNESDALKKLQQSSYIMGGGSNFQTPSISLGGVQRQLPSFWGISPQQPSAADKEGASALQGQVLSRLQPGGSFIPAWNYTPRPVEEYAKPGLAENIGSYGGAIAGGLGSIDRMMGIGNTLSGGRLPTLTGAIGKGIKGLGGLLGFSGGNAAPLVNGISTSLPGAIGSQGASQAVRGVGNAVGGASKLLGKAIPIAGAITGGIGLMKDRGVASNLMNGVSTGASIGSIVPGLGTAVGAGIGALVGGLRSIGGGPSKEELQVRSGMKPVVDALTSRLTPQQMQEVSAGTAEGNDAGWMKGAVAIRDLYKNAGLGDRGSHVWADLLNAEHKGDVSTAGKLLAEIQTLAGNR